MPAGPGPVGFAAFTGVKLVGYLMAASVLKKGFNAANANIFKVGLARTGIGLVVGAVFGGTWILLATHSSAPSGDVASIIFFLLLIPIRIGEWSLLIHLFFDRGLTDRKRDTKYAALGTFWSFALDGAGIFAAFVVPGGFWIC